ncbi:redox-regulated molecular chaperone HslO [Selenomonas sp. TAMA-11512]|uniref:Hsp33 family molecular chaperone HslO n=1 Tax=Selenomonas sp. TAMA-11512 TaxID=3095337 RepID=UPI003090170F|nr:redox-regulated molecular chaperone HslO [Selenomonas sp. TAMA-11512]
MKDTIVKAVADGVRIYTATTTNLVNEAVRRHGLLPIAAAALGRTLTGGLLFAANLKNDEALTIRFAGDGPLGQIVVDATPEGYARGYVDHPEAALPLNEAGKLDVGGAVGHGFLSVTRFTGIGDPQTGSSEIVSGEIADDLTAYLAVSEQTPSSVGLGVLVDTDFRAKAAGGFFLQPLPDATDEVLTCLEENLKTLRPVSDMVHDGMDARAMIKEILKGFAHVDYLTETDLSFRCHCSKERVEGVLLGLGRAELESLVEEGHAEVKCHFCNEAYTFDKAALESLLK